MDAFTELLFLTAYSFQENLLKTMLQIESTFKDLAVSMSSSNNCLIICDRGAMDATACWYYYRITFVSHAVFLAIS